ncbi:restriction endonuclease subunit S [Brevibacterium linens]|uniref:restriction endonuclease subunit S n=1 Tax=Brevibacterium linens TaxID=1703 RepID=UPI000C784579|nr:restriction endonuclease subunit S [Brevibacterium linens]KAB1948643.1 restriction endonuclease subunit S [Brevibacterium linens ATCC 9172]
MSWLTRNLSELVTLQRGHDLPESHRAADGQIPVVGSSGITGVHDVARYPGPGVAIGRSGASIGVATYVKEPYWPLNTCLFVTDFKGNDPRWVYWMLKGIDFVGFNSGSAQPSLNRNYLAGIPVYVPPRDVQAAIAEVLGALDDKIAANERLSGAVQDLLQERFALLRLDGFTGDGSFLTVSDLFDVNPRTSQKLAGQAPYLGMKDLPDSSMTVGSWSTREAKSGARFINGDVLLARITPCLENGKAGYVDFLENTEVGVGSTEFIVFRARSPLLSAVPFFLTKSERFRDFAIKHMQGTSGRQRLAAADVADYRLAKVDDESLNRFGELSLSLLKRVKTAVSESRALARTRDELLPLLMNGKITVKDAEAVVSDAV